MIKWKLAGTTAVAALLAGGAALADVTPEDVWQNWQDMSVSAGQTITATSAARDGDTLVVSGMSAKSDQGGGSVDVSIDEVRFTDNGDGTVNVTMSDSYEMQMTLPAEPGVEGDVPTDLTITISQPGMVTTVSGTPEETAYAVQAPTVAIKLDSIEGVDAAAVNATVELTLSTVAGTYMIAGPADAKTMDVDFGSESLAVSVVAKDLSTQTDFQMTGTVADLAASYIFNFAGMEQLETNAAAALRAGSTLSADISYGAMDFTLDLTEAKGPAKLTAIATGGGFDFAMDASGLTYAVTGTGTNLTLSGPDIPFPELKINYGEIAFNLAMPLLASDQPSDFAFLTRVVDLSVSDELWAMVDPTGSLPHDPATVIVNTKGSVRLTTDLVDDTAMAALGEGAPGEINAVEVIELKATAAGAALTGAGAFTFDNTDLVTFDGVPAPTGKIDLKLVGGNGLLDKLVGMGVLTEEDAGGARMMMSMFANAGPAEDELNSTLEFKDKGFYANGQRLQ